MEGCRCRQGWAGALISRWSKVRTRRRGPSAAAELACARSPEIFGSALPPTCCLAMDSSRIFVRGLPPAFTEDDVRRHFAHFPVTDVKYFPARRIGYVGYKTPHEAAKAVKHFNKSFIRMTRIHVEMARPVSL